MTEIKESTNYDNFMDKLGSTKVEKEEYLDFLGDVADNSNPNSPDKHWVGMPEFDNPDVKEYKKLIITFRTEEDYKEFARLIKQNLTPKTKSIRFPEREIEDIFSMRWVEDEPSN